MIELIDKILATDIHEAVKVYKSELKKFGKELYGMDCGSCDNRLLEVYVKLSKNGKQIMKNKAERKAKLKDNVVLRVPSMGITWTNESLDFTDKKALEVLKKFEALKGRFDILPEEIKPVKKQTIKKEEKKPAEKEIKKVKNED